MRGMPAAVHAQRFQPQRELLLRLAGAGLFFGLTVPVALKSAGGWSFPGLFALGSSLPLLVAAGLVTVGAGAMGKMLGSMRPLERPLRLAAGFLLLVVGLHDTLLYWAL